MVASIEAGIIVEEEDSNAEIAVAYNSSERCSAFRLDRMIDSNQFLGCLRNFCGQVFSKEP
jgi:hypothetical protein